MQYAKQPKLRFLYILSPQCLRHRVPDVYWVTRNMHQLRPDTQCGRVINRLCILPHSYPLRTSFVPGSVSVRSSSVGMERRRDVGNMYRLGNKICLSTVPGCFLSRHIANICKEMSNFAQLYVPLSTIMLSMMLHCLGLTGFDSGQKWYVSMQWVGNYHLNLSYQKIIWQRKLCSRCLIEVQ